eukprot:CAMPEP_0178387434 /NCGR_PEP_ID=MMETSP0689_2-20121128/9072_1 /TAXON_ID=160604 /ORGANISM="Amphidinium massartii, Strain CS-259" /LENGTH=47 /DNA_ID= /DNA_START= /DNA_END= /DNA_ORIENTATION=
MTSNEHGHSPLHLIHVLSSASKPHLFFVVLCFPCLSILDIGKCADMV